MDTKNKYYGMVKDTMKVAGISQVRNEIEVIDFAIWHHLDQGLDRLFISDNGSTDGTLEVIREWSERDDRVVLYNNDGPFHQERALTLMAQMAYEDGCAWCIPFDGDELWLSDNGLKTDIMSLDDYEDGVRVHLVNFIQNYNHSTLPYEIYSSVKWKIPDSINYATQVEVEYKLRSMLEFRWDRKHILKLSDNLYIGEGSHTAAPSFRFIRCDDPRWKVYHVPIRSYTHMIRKAENGLRIKEAGYPYGYGWEAHIWADQYLSGTLLGEWRANSEIGGVLTRYDGTELMLQEDSAVSDIYARYVSEMVNRER